MYDDMIVFVAMPVSQQNKPLLHKVLFGVSPSNLGIYIIVSEFETSLCTKNVQLY